MIDINELIYNEFNFRDYLKQLLEKENYIVECEKYLQSLEIREDESIINLKKRIDIYAVKDENEYYIELKDFRKITLKQLYEYLGDLFIQIKTYKYIIETSTEEILGYKTKKTKKFVVGFLLPLNIGYNDIKSIIKMFECQDINILKIIDKKIILESK